MLPLVSPPFALFQDASGWRHHRNHTVPSSLIGRKCEGVSRASANQEGSTHSSLPRPCRTQAQLYPCTCLHPSVLAGPGPIQQNCSHCPGAGTSWEAGQDEPLAPGLPQDM